MDILANAKILGPPLDKWVLWKSVRSSRTDSKMRAIEADKQQSGRLIARNSVQKIVRLTFAAFFVPAFDCGNGAVAGFLPFGGYH